MVSVTIADVTCLKQRHRFFYSNNNVVPHFLIRGIKHVLCVINRQLVFPVNSEIGSCGAAPPEVGLFVCLIGTPNAQTVSVIRHPIIALLLICQHIGTHHINGFAFYDFPRSERF